MDNIPNNQNKIKELAETLRRNGLAASETESLRMAESMTQTENKVNQNFDNKKEAITKQSTPYSRSEVTQESQPVQASRENEVSTQEAPVQQETPAPTHENNALNNAINAVKEHYTPEAHSNIDIDPETPLSEAVGEAKPTPEAAVEEVAPEESTPQTPLENRAPVETPVVESVPQQEEHFAEPEPEPTPEPHEEFTQEAPQEETVAEQVQEEYIKPAQESSSQTITTPQPQPVVTEQGGDSFSQPEPVVETPTEEPQVAEPVVEASVEQPPQEAEQPETTQEIHEKPPEKDVSNMEESKVKLHDVFDFSKR